jgi:hypothetical protein
VEDVGLRMQQFAKKVKLMLMQALDVFVCAFDPSLAAPS